MAYTYALMGMMESHMLLAGIWIVYCVLHSVLAASDVKRWLGVTTGRGAERYRLGYNIFAFLSLVPVLIYQFTIASNYLFRPGPGTQVAGGIIGAFGLVVMLICISKYFMQLSGLKTVAASEEELIVTGIHKWVRHPLYLGTFLFIWGAWIVWPYLSLLICNMVITVYTVIGIRYEEKKLIGQFGEKYKEYQKRVAKLIPFVY